MSTLSSDKIFGPTINIVANALDLRSRRHEVILSNVANADTPGYKAFDLLVDEALANQLTPNESATLRRTDPAHIAANESATGGVKPTTVHLSPQVTLRGDGNTVDMDREMSNLASNQLLYKASAQIVSRKFKGLLDVIQGGGQS